MTSPEVILALHQRVAALKEQARRGWILRGVPEPESVADHSLGVAALAAAVAPDLGLDRGEVVTMAALHDLCEALCGDIIPADRMDPAEKLRREQAAMERALTGIPGADELLERWLDTALERTPEGKLVKELDTLEMVLQADRYEGRHDVDLSEFFAALDRLQSPPLVKLADLLRRRRAARILLAHLSPADAPQPAELIIGFGVFHMSVPEQCARLYREGAAPKILFTGGIGAGSADLQEPEALAFRRRALELGVPADAILVEPDSTNTLENILASKQVLLDAGLAARLVHLVALPHRQRRVWLTCIKQLPGVELINSPPPSNLDEQAFHFGGLDGYAEQLLGELERIRRYGQKGDIWSDDPGEEVSAASEVLRPLMFPGG